MEQRDNTLQSLNSTIIQVKKLLHQKNLKIQQLEKENRLLKEMLKQVKAKELGEDLIVLSKSKELLEDMKWKK